MNSCHNEKISEWTIAENIGTKFSACDVLVAYVYSIPLLSKGHMFQDPQWMPDSADSTHTCDNMFFPKHTYL